MKVRMLWQRSEIDILYKNDDNLSGREKERLLDLFLFSFCRSRVKFLKWERGLNFLKYFRHFFWPFMISRNFLLHCNVPGRRTLNSHPLVRMSLLRPIHTVRKRFFSLMFVLNVLIINACSFSRCVSWPLRAKSSPESSSNSQCQRKCVHGWTFHKSRVFT